MFSLIKPVFIVLLSFIESLATKCMFLKNELYMNRSSIIDLNPVELGNYSFMISLDKGTGSCNVLSQQICVSKETNDINFKAFTMLINKNKAKK